MYLLVIAVDVFFCFNDTATTEIYTLSLHDALPICPWRCCRAWPPRCSARTTPTPRAPWTDRKSTRLNSSHTVISYAVFCLHKTKQSVALPIDEKQTKNKQSTRRKQITT